MNANREEIVAGGNRTSGKSTRTDGNLAQRAIHFGRRMSSGHLALGLIAVKTRIQKLLVGAALLAATTLAQAQYNYSNNGNGTCTITGYTGPGGAVTIPNSLNGLTVIGIDYAAFAHLTIVTSVVIPDGVTNIGSSAFNSCTSLTSVTIGNGVTSIGYAAFWDCTSLTNITIPVGVTSIGNYAFGYCTSLTNITVDPANSFYSSANGVLFDKNQTVLIQCAEGKTGSYVIPGSVTNIVSDAFEYCGLTNITIGNGVTSIGGEAFDNCTSLTSVTIPNTVTNIGVLAFYNCTSLTSVTIPNTVTSIGSWALAFYACTSLTNITVDPANSFYSSANGVLFDKNQTVLIQCPDGKTGSYVIPGSVTTIGSYAFEYCGLTNITIPGSVTNIGSLAFGDCTNLTSVTIGNGVTSIGDEMFYNCTNLTNVTIPGSVTNIGFEVFLDCTSLTSVTIGNGVTSIGDLEFDACTSLTNIIIPNTVTKIGIRAFDGCTSLTSVTIPGSVTSIGNYAFYDCTSLTSAFFLGNTPPDPGNVFLYDPVTVYYLPGATGWGLSFGGARTELWNPQASALVTGQTFTTLFSFTAIDSVAGTNSDGANPYAGVIMTGNNNTRYATAANGGSAGYGTVFAINADGTGQTNLHDFTGGSDGANPWAGLINSGNTLYGTAYHGGNWGDGTVFAVNTDGTGFTNLHDFNDNDGAYPNGGLILVGNTLYGTTSRGGDSDYGTVFAVNTDGTGFTNLHSFFYRDGAVPVAGFTSSGNTLYGTTTGGGAYGNGTVFSVLTDGTGFTVLYSFTPTYLPCLGGCPPGTQCVDGRCIGGGGGGGGCSSCSPGAECINGTCVCRGFCGGI